MFHRQVILLVTVPVIACTAGPAADEAGPTADAAGDVAVQPLMSRGQSPPAVDELDDYPPWRGVDLNCTRDIHHPVRVTGEDPHRLDTDHDGVGCENEGR